MIKIQRKKRYRYALAFQEQQQSLNLFGAIVGLFADIRPWLPKTNLHIRIFFMDGIHENFQLVSNLFFCKVASFQSPIPMLGHTTGERLVDGYITDHTTVFGHIVYRYKHRIYRSHNVLATPGLDRATLQIDFYSLVIEPLERPARHSAFVKKIL